MFIEHELVDIIARWREGRANGWDVAKEFFAFLYVIAVLVMLAFVLFAIKPGEAEELKEIVIFMGAIPALLAARKLMLVTNRLERIYKEEADPKKRLHNVLVDLLCVKGEKKLSPHASDLAKQCEDLLSSVSALVKDKDVWASQRYVQFIATLVRSVVGSNAHEFSKLVDDDINDRTLEVPKNAAKLADEILKAQMEELKGKDSYVVISDLGSWQSGQLGKFLEETKCAVTERGITVSRIFNLMLNDEPWPSDAGSILRKHMLAAEDWNKNSNGGKYLLKVIREEDWDEVSKAKPGLLKKKVTSSQSAHFGIFKHESEMVRFRVEESDLSIMKLCRNKGTLQGSLDIFESLWHGLPDLTEDIVREIERNMATKRKQGSRSQDGEGERVSLEGL